MQASCFAQGLPISLCTAGSKATIEGLRSGGWPRASHAMNRMMHPIASSFCENVPFFLSSAPFQTLKHSPAPFSPMPIVDTRQQEPTPPLRDSQAALVDVGCWVSGLGTFCRTFPSTACPCFVQGFQKVVHTHTTWNAGSY